MAVPAAVALVRQVQSIAESQELLKEHDCVDQVVCFLDCFLDHPDIRARMGAARTLARLTARLSDHERSRQDMPQARRILARMESEGQQNDVDSDADEMYSLLKAVFGNSDEKPFAQSEALLEEKKSVACDGEAVLRIGTNAPLGAEVRLAISRSLIEIAGVVSVTYECNDIVVGTRTPELAHDTTLIDDVRITVEEQLVHCGGFSHRALRVAPVRASDAAAPLSDNASSCSDDVPIYLDDDSDEAEKEVCNANPSKYEGNSEMSSDVDEPVYLDDSEDENDGDTCQDFSKEASSTKGWSLFGRDGWISFQKLHEHDDDPTLIARLRRARLRSERKQREEKSRVRRLLSVMTPLRNFGQSNSSK